jgi:hypothetical protein
VTPVPDIAASMQGLADRLTAGGVRATIDPRDLNPPCALVAAPVVRWVFASGRLAVDWRLVVVVPSSGAANELKALGELLGRIAGILAGEPVQATPADYPDPGGGDPLPAYQLTWTTKTKE